MSNLTFALPIGVAAGLVASAAMEAYQTLAAKPFGQDDASSDPSTVKAADTASTATTGDRVTQRRRAGAGRLVHYLTGAILGILYAVLVLYRPTAAIGFGVVFGIVVSLVLDDVVVPAFGWGSPAWKTPLAAHAYGLSAHIVFGAVLEATRRLAWVLLL